ncbi:MAG: 1-acyl-sn-glycerol-3-phosphate acyltransferase [Planctomycetota bacterium]|nr:MAG: 1-acyl-sn-glycerol-3-phosphate acyltransferase [Planctomycetota bacterium]
MSHASCSKPSVPVLRHTIYWRLCRFIARLLCCLLFRSRWFNGAAVPRTGPLLIVSNHQSYLDPPLIACGVMHRPLGFLARAGLFKSRLLARLLRSFNSVPLSENGGDVGAMKTTIALLEAGNAVVIFPEGSRTPDGRMGEFKRGTSLIIKKVNCPVLPVAVEGAFEAWPRHRSLPVPFVHRVWVQFGTPISHDVLMADGPDAALRTLEAEVARLRTELRRRMGKPIESSG